MKSLRRLYYRLFKRYRRLELRYVDWSLADSLIQHNPGKPERQQWVIAVEEDYNPLRRFKLDSPPCVYIERRERITE